MSALVVRTVSALDDAAQPVLVVISGEIDIVSAPELHRHLQALPQRDAVVDVSGVTFLSAAGLAVLLAAVDRLERSGARVVLAALSRAFSRVMDACEPDTRPPTAPTIGDAIAGLARPGYAPRRRGGT